MSKYIIAYANESTGWMWLLYAYGTTLNSTKETAAIYAKTDFPNSMVAVFVDRPDWINKKPYAVYNSHLYAKAHAFGSALGNLIDSVNSDFTVNK